MEHSCSGSCESERCPCSRSCPCGTARNVISPVLGVKPYRCPVCLGRGIVENGFYNKTTGTGTAYNTAPDECRACCGEGLVWG